jgi:zinc D-Ala-D-Ala carboxypeptidase
MSAHFTFAELCISKEAVRLGIDNTPDAVAAANLERIADLMERVRAQLGNRAVLVHSGYRSLAVNTAVGGVAASAHCQGLACDFVCPSFGPPLEIARELLRSDIEYDQLILEYGWVHISLAQKGLLARRQSLTKSSKEKGYEPGIISV